MPVPQICWVTVARIVAEAVKGQVTPLPAGVSWNAALQTIDTSAKKLSFQVPFMGTFVVFRDARIHSLTADKISTVEVAVQEISDAVRIIEVH